jgi:RHS repeat-associated protein
VELLVTTEEISGVYSIGPEGGWDRQSFRRYAAAPSFDLKDPEVRLIDLDGDGATDAVRSGARIECFFNDRDRGWTDTKQVERRALDAFPDVNFSDPRVRWADMCGAGLQGPVLVHNGSIEYWPSLGHGRWGKRVVMRNAPRLPERYDPRRLLLGDIDGDGAADLMLVEDTKVTLWINRSGNAWSGPITIHGTPPITDVDSVRLCDLLGNGVAGVLWSAEGGPFSAARMFFLDLTGGVKPYLLNEMDNHMGAVTRVEYTSSTLFYMEDSKRRETRWKTTLPFPVQVVSRVEVIDEISRGKLTTEYSYHHGHWDGAEREFRGFARVHQRDTEVFERYQSAGLHPVTRAFESVPETQFAPPTERRTWYHAGPIGDERGDWVELDLRHEFWPGDASLLARPPAMTNFLAGLPRRARRDALRALRGRVVRTELYARDESPNAERPYSVTESLHGVSALLPGIVNGPAGSWQQSVFLPHLLANRSTEWERGDDPMTEISFIEKYDDFGQPLAQTTIHLPRRSELLRQVTDVAGVVHRPDETRVLATHTTTDYASPDTGLYLHDRVSRTCSFELGSPPPVVEAEPTNVARVLRDQMSAAVSVSNAFRGALEPWAYGQPLPSLLRLLGQTINHYDGQAFVGRVPGVVGPFGALTCSETLVFTQDRLIEAYGPRRPVYLGGSASLPTGSPVGFGSAAGYRDEQASTDGHVAGYFATTRSVEFDFQRSTASERRGLVLSSRDALGNATNSDPDTYWIFPSRVTEATGLETVTVYDYRVFDVGTVTDVNGHSSRFDFSALGLLRRQVVTGRMGEGGTIAKPEVELTYDFLAFERSRFSSRPQPIFSHTRKRVWHASHRGGDAVIESRVYSDGIGRIVQQRAQADEIAFDATDSSGLQTGITPGAASAQRIADRVSVTGWQVYDNKGRIVRKYEPQFSRGWQFGAPTDLQSRVFSELIYDARGRVVRTTRPDGAERRIICGAPLSVEAPDDFTPTPWERFDYDENDLAPLSADRGSGSTLASRAASGHHLTPTSVLFDGRGRIICQIERSGTGGADAIVTRSEFDLRGNLLRSGDAAQRDAARFIYDLLNRPLRCATIDAGVRTSVFDAAGNLMEYRDALGRVVLRRYDVASRLTHLWASDDPALPITLRERVTYGDDGDRVAARAANRLGRPFEHFDEAGLARTDRYDFKGNAVQKSRRTISDTAIANGWTADWNAPNALAALEQVEYRTDAEFDALNRAVKLTYPSDVNGHRAVLDMTYGRSGALARLDLDGTEFVSAIAYNAREQRVLVHYGNGMMTRYAYDPLTFALARQRTERAAATTSSVGVVWMSSGSCVQDEQYSFDLVGNVVGIEHLTPNCGIDGSVTGRDRLVRAFAYDPLYRLIRATGRGCKDTAGPRPLADLVRSGFLSPSPRCGVFASPFGSSPSTPTQTNAPQLTEAYVEQYEYDLAGNLIKLHHQTASATWARESGFGGAPYNSSPLGPSNRLTSLTQGGATFALAYDANGNLRSRGVSHYYAWDHADRLVSFETRANATAPATLQARYLYAADGTRVKKWVRQAGMSGESTTYIAAVFERYSSASLAIQHDRLHVMDGQQRVATVRRGPARPDDAGPAIQFHHSDHLGSAAVIVDDVGSWVNREEFYPYGETSFGCFAGKHYRFMGKELDEESALYYHGARYYAPWLTRWTSCDPAGITDGVNLYRAFRCNPLKYIDPSGTDSDVSGTPPAPNEQSTMCTPAPLKKDPVAGYTGGPKRYGENLPVQLTDTHAPVDVDRDIWHEMWESFAGSALGSAGLRRESDAQVPRKQYVNGNALNYAMQGYTEFAELVEAGHGCAACHLTVYFGHIPTNAELNLDSYNRGSLVMVAARETLMAGLDVGGRFAARPRVNTMAQNRRIGKANEGMANLSMERSGVPFTPGEERTLKDAVGKSAKGSTGKTAKPDLMLHGENNSRSPIECKVSDTPSTRATAASQLESRASIINKGAYWREGDQLLPVVPGEGTNVCYGWWHTFPPPAGTKN